MLIVLEHFQEYSKEAETRSLTLKQVAVGFFSLL